MKIEIPNWRNHASYKIEGMTPLFHKEKARKLSHYYLFGLINSIELVVGKLYFLLPTAKSVCDFGCGCYSDLKNSSQIYYMKT